MVVKRGVQNFVSEAVGWTYDAVGDATGSQSKEGEAAK
jgi:hypothetical protein